MHPIQPWESHRTDRDPEAKPGHHPPPVALLQPQLPQQGLRLGLHDEVVAGLGDELPLVPALDGRREAPAPPDPDPCLTLA